jgi:hypothetical protein
MVKATVSKGALESSMWFMLCGLKLDFKELSTFNLKALQKYGFYEKNFYSEFQFKKKRNIPHPNSDKVDQEKIDIDIEAISSIF